MPHWSQRTSYWTPRKKAASIILFLGQTERFFCASCAFSRRFPPQSQTTAHCSVVLMSEVIWPTGAAVSPQLSLSRVEVRLPSPCSESFETSLAADVWKAGDLGPTRRRKGACVKRFTPWAGREGFKSSAQEGWWWRWWRWWWGPAGTTNSFYFQFPLPPSNTLMTWGTGVPRAWEQTERGSSSWALKQSAWRRITDCDWWTVKQWQRSEIHLL